MDVIVKGILAGLVGVPTAILALLYVFVFVA